MDVHLVVKYAVHHSKAVLAQFFFQCCPFWRVEQGSYTTGATKVTSNIAGTRALNHFKFAGANFLQHVQKINIGAMGGVFHCLLGATAGAHVSAKSFIDTVNIFGKRISKDTALKGRTAIDRTFMSVWQAEHVLYCTGDATWGRLIKDCPMPLTHADAEFNVRLYTKHTYKIAKKIHETAWP